MDVFAAIADPVRRELLREIGTGTMRVIDLSAGRPISRPAVSRHLRVLSDAGLVSADDVGRERHYRLQPEGLGVVAAFVTEVTRAHPRPPVTAVDLAALDLEVRRTGRDRRAAEGSADGTASTPPTPRHRTGETA